MLAEAVMCLALNLWHEARGEGQVGMFAVAEVVQRRVDSPRWPDSHCGVVHQPWQFSWTHEDPAPPDTSSPAWSTAVTVATLGANGLLLDWNGRGAVTDCADHYYAPAGMANGAAPDWAERLEYEGALGGHRFYCTDGQRGASPIPTLNTDAPERPYKARTEEVASSGPSAQAHAAEAHSVQYGSLWTCTDSGSGAAAALMENLGSELCEASSFRAAAQIPPYPLPQPAAGEEGPRCIPRRWGRRAGRGPPVPSGRVIWRR